MKVSQVIQRIRDVAPYRAVVGGGLNSISAELDYVDVASLGDTRPQEARDSTFESLYVCRSGLPDWILPHLRTTGVHGHDDPKLVFVWPRLGHKQHRLSFASASDCRVLPVCFRNKCTPRHRPWCCQEASSVGLGLCTHCRG